MKFYLFLSCIIIILFKTENVLSYNDIFNVNNIEIDKKTSKNRANLINKAFLKGFKNLTDRLLMEEDQKKISNTELNEIKSLVSYYQILSQKDKNDDKIKFNIYFDRNKMHNFFNKKNLLYSDIINAEAIFLPVLISNKDYYIYSKNFFYENWKLEDPDELIEYLLPVESIESIQVIENFKDNIYDLDLKELFKEYNYPNQVLAIIEANNKTAKVFLNTNIGGKKLNKNLNFKNQDLNEKEFYMKIAKELKKTIRDLIKSQNLIDVKTPSFLNVEIKLNNKSNLVEFKKRIQNIELIDNFYIQKLNKDYAVVKIKYLGKISKIISELEDQDINLKINKGQWILTIT